MSIPFKTCMGMIREIPVWVGLWHVGSTWEDCDVTRAQIYALEQVDDGLGVWVCGPLTYIYVRAFGGRYVLTPNPKPRTTPNIHLACPFLTAQQEHNTKKKKKDILTVVALHGSGRTCGGGSGKWYESYFILTIAVDRAVAAVRV